MWLPPPFRSASSDWLEFLSGGLSRAPIDEVPILHAGEPFGLGRGKTRGRYAAGARWLRRRLAGME